MNFAPGVRPGQQGYERSRTDIDLPTRPEGDVDETPRERAVKPVLRLQTRQTGISNRLELRIFLC